MGARSRFVFVEDPVHTPSTNTKRDLAPTQPHKLYPHSRVDIAYRKVLHVQPEDGQH